MLSGPWAMGNNYTIADPYLFTVAQLLEATALVRRKSHW